MVYQWGFRHLKYDLPLASALCAVEPVGEGSASAQNEIQSSWMNGLVWCATECSWGLEKLVVRWAIAATEFMKAKGMLVHDFTWIWFLQAVWTRGRTILKTSRRLEVRDLSTVHHAARAEASSSAASWAAISTCSMANIIEAVLEEGCLVDVAVLHLCTQVFGAQVLGFCLLFSGAACQQNRRRLVLIDLLQVASCFITASQFLPLFCDPKLQVGLTGLQSGKHLACHF